MYPSYLLTLTMMLSPTFPVVNHHQQANRAYATHVLNADRRIVCLFNGLVVNHVVPNPLVIVVYSFILVPSSVLRRFSDISRVHAAARTSGDEILTLRMFARISSSSSQMDSAPH